MRLWPPSPPLRFILGFGLWIGLFSLILQVPAVDDWIILPLMEASAHASSAGLRLFGYETTVDGNRLQQADGSFSVNIQKGCDASYVMAIFAAAILAFPAPWKMKLLGILAGLPAVQVINLGRIMSLYYIGLEHPALFETFHLDVWQTIVIILSMALWLGWAELTNHVAGQ